MRLGEILQYFYVPIERIFDGTDQENSKKTRRKEWRKEKEENFTNVEVRILLCSPLVGNALRLLPYCNPPSGEPLVWNIPYNIICL
jgi:hypothetical protein